MDSIHCIVCLKKLERCYFGEVARAAALEIKTPPEDAIHARTYGNWGSRVYDLEGTPDRQLHLEFYVCDSCLVSRAKYVLEVDPDGMANWWNPQEASWAKCGTPPTD